MSVHSSSPSRPGRRTLIALAVALLVLISGAVVASGQEGSTTTEPAEGTEETTTTEAPTTTDAPATTEAPAAPAADAEPESEEPEEGDDPETDEPKPPKPDRGKADHAEKRGPHPHKWDGDPCRGPPVWAGRPSGPTPEELAAHEAGRAGCPEDDDES